MVGMCNDHPVLICFLAAKNIHTLDLRLLHGRHAASICLRFTIEDWFSSGLCVRIAVVGSGSEVGVVEATAVDDDGDDSCEERRFGELTDIESASTLPGNFV